MDWKAPATALLIALSVVGQWGFRQAGLRHAQATQVYEHVFFVPPPTFLHLMSLGHREALADLLWVRGLIYLGEEAVRNLGADHVLAYGRAVTSLDRRFGRAYRVFAISANSRPASSEQVQTQRIRDALAFLEEGVKALPEDGELAWDTGSVYAYTLAPRLADMEAFQEAKRRGVEHMRAATLRGAGPPWAGLANASTLIKLGQKEQAVAHLQELYAITSDPAVRDQIANQIGWLQSTSFMEGMRAAVSELDERRTKEFPYVPQTLHLLLGRRPPLDRSALLRSNFDPAFLSNLDD